MPPGRVRSRSPRGSMVPERFTRWVRMPVLGRWVFTLATVTPSAARDTRVRHSIRAKNPASSRTAVRWSPLVKRDLGFSPLCRRTRSSSARMFSYSIGFRAMGNTTFWVVSDCPPPNFGWRGNYSER